MPSISMHLTVPQQHLFIVDDHLRQLVQMIDDLAARLAGEILVLCLAYVQRGVRNRPGLSASTAPTWSVS